MSSRDEEGLETVSFDSGMIDRSFTDVVSDLEAHRARELSLTLQNDRLRSIVRQSSLESPISPRQNATCSVRILSVDHNVVQVREEFVLTPHAWACSCISYLVHAL